MEKLVGAKLRAAPVEGSAGEEKKQPGAAAARFRKAGEQVRYGALQVRLNSAFAKQMRVRQIERERPAFDAGMPGLSDEQVNAVQGMIDQSVDWLKLYVKTGLLVHIDDIKTSVESARNDMEAESYEHRSRCDRMEIDVNDCVAHVGRLAHKFQLDRSTLAQFKQRLHSDMTLEIGKMRDLVARNDEATQIHAAAAVKQDKILSHLLEANMVESLLQSQDASDKKQLALFGLRTNAELLGSNQAYMGHYSKEGGRGSSAPRSSSPGKVLPGKVLKGRSLNAATSPGLARSSSPHPLKLDRTCANCMKSGEPSAGVGLPLTHPSHLVQQLKQACLAYSCSPVRYRGAEVDQV